jgi:repressor LexA
MNEHTHTVFRFVCQYSRQHGFPPSIREIAAQCYLSRSTVVRYLDQLEAWGWIARETGKARGILILQADKCAEAEKMGQMS